MPSWIFLMHLIELNFCVIFVNLILIMKLSFTQSCLWEEIHFMIIRSVPGNSINTLFALNNLCKGNICCCTKCTGFIAKWSYSIIFIRQSNRVHHITAPSDFRITELGMVNDPSLCLIYLSSPFWYLLKSWLFIFGASGYKILRECIIFKNLH